MSLKLSYSEFEWLFDAQLRKAKIVFTNNDWLDTARYLELQKRLLREHKRVLFADVNGIVVLFVRNDIKPFTVYIFEVDYEYPDAINDSDDKYLFALKVMEIRTKMLSNKHMFFCRLDDGEYNIFSSIFICLLLYKISYVVFSETLILY